MCLSTVYKLGVDESDPVCSMVSNVEVDGDKITFTDILGTQTVLTGNISKVDLVGAKIYVATPVGATT